MLVELSKLSNRSIVLASATFALKAGLWFRRVRFFISAPGSQAKHACCQAEIPRNPCAKFLGHLTCAAAPKLQCCNNATTKRGNALAGGAGECAADGYGRVVAITRSNYF
jgi:hypothetical protein